MGKQNKRKNPIDQSSSFSDQPAVTRVEGWGWAQEVVQPLHPFLCLHTLPGDRWLVLQCSSCEGHIGLADRTGGQIKPDAAPSISGTEITRPCSSHSFVSYASDNHVDGRAEHLALCVCQYDLQVFCVHVV